jgi:hypothetical protein
VLVLVFLFVVEKMILQSEIEVDSKPVGYLLAQLNAEI